MNHSEDDSQTLPSVNDMVKHLPLRPVPQIFVLLEGERPAEQPVILQLEDRPVLELGRDATRHVTGLNPCRLHLPDRWMSTLHARIAARKGGFVLEDLGSKNGTAVNGIEQEQHLLRDGDLIEVGHSLLLFRDSLPPCMAHAPSSHRGFSTISPTFARELSGITAVAASRVPVLIHGETGTGKELIARGVHKISGAQGAFVAVNCGALAPTLLEAELFGYRRGAFSGAVKDHPGLIRAAEGGTLFLDEIADLAPAGQAALLRAVQESEVLPIGEVKPIKVDFRLVAATHSNLGALVEEGRFRKDLFARVAGYVLELPPLRARREDLSLLIGTLLTRLAAGRLQPVRFNNDAGRALYRYDWPLNVRELERCLEAALALAGDGVVRLEHLPESVRRMVEVRVTVPDSDPPVADERALSAEDIDRKVELHRLLQEHNGNISAVAKAMGKARVQIRRWIKRYGL